MLAWLSSSVPLSIQALADPTYVIVSIHPDAPCLMFARWLLCIDTISTSGRKQGRGVVPAFSSLYQENKSLPRRSRSGLPFTSQ